VQQSQDDELRLDINYVSIQDNGLTPLGMAIKHRHLTVAEYLIDKGANVNSVNKVKSKQLLLKPTLDLDEAIDIV
jgi:ankyrin repeat protein